MYKTNFILMQEHKYSLEEIEEMIPWERTIYVSMLIEHIKLINEKAKKIRKKN